MMLSADPAADSSGSEEAPPAVRVSIDNAPPTVIEDGENGAGDGADDDGKATEPLYHSSRLKGYTTLFVSSLYNYLAASDTYHGERRADKLHNICLEYDDLANLVDRVYNNLERLRYAMACSMITVVITGLIIFCHFDFCTPLRKNAWQKSFGPSSKVELAILLFLTIFWLVATWFNTTIEGPGGEGKEQHNLYFSSWICTWASLWTLERWCTCSGRASFETFITSWPNRSPLWIMTFILSLVDFMFVLDTFRNWEEGTRYSPYVFKLYSEVPQSEWTLLFFVTCITFVISAAWALAEIFRENVTNADNVKSDVEFYVEGLTVHIISLIWIVTVCIVTMPGGAASLLGNLYFTTWSTLISVIATLIWFVRDWRKMIVDIIQEQQDQYDSVKKALRKREEDRLARQAQKEREDFDPLGHDVDSSRNVEEAKMEEDDEAVLCEDDPVDDDITISIASGWRGTSFASSSPDQSGKKSPPADPVESSEVTTSSLFVSAISYFFSGTASKKEGADQHDSSFAKEKAANSVTNGDK